jgi:hypothetical protein
VPAADVGVVVNKLLPVLYLNFLLTVDYTNPKIRTAPKGRV